MDFAKCIFCDCHLERMNYGYVEENDERAEGSYTLDICKDCAKELKNIINRVPKDEGDN